MDDDRATPASRLVRALTRIPTAAVGGNAHRSIIDVDWAHARDARDAAARLLERDIPSGREALDVAVPDGAAFRRVTLTTAVPDLQVALCVANTLLEFDDALGRGPEAARELQEARSAAVLPEPAPATLSGMLDWHSECTLSGLWNHAVTALHRAPLGEPVSASTPAADILAVLLLDFVTLAGTTPDIGAFLDAYAGQPLLLETARTLDRAAGPERAVLPVQAKAPQGRRLMRDQVTSR
jgi:hypothetical protein